MMPAYLPNYWQYCIPEDHNFSIQHDENLKSHKLLHQPYQLLDIMSSDISQEFTQSTAVLSNRLVYC
jgi:hypothetical protein